ncbi:MAG: grasp-with-spasm system ATP-grasp peptide maturase, partial [Bacteroidota bacterium]
MILVNSNHDDVSTMMVAKWLHYLKKPFILLFDNATINNICFTNDENAYFELADGRQFFFDKTSSYWYRRGQNRFQKRQETVDGKLPKFNQKAKKFLIDENVSFSDFIDYYLSTKKSINKLSSSKNVNKLILADIAKKSGFKTPATVITNSKKELKAFIHKHGSAITKPIETLLDYSTDHHWLPMYTEEVTQKIFDQLPDTFAYSLFQEKIEKKYELRIFCLHKQKYAMAIFSQRDQQTSIDFRKYNMKKPNRNIPFQLPNQYSKMIDEFMERSGYNSGSFDILVDQKNDYYFLEINPV